MERFRPAVQRIRERHRVNRMFRVGQDVECPEEHRSRNEEGAVRYV